MNRPADIAAIAAAIAVDEGESFEGEGGGAASDKEMARGAVGIDRHSIGQRGGVDGEGFVDRHFPEIKDAGLPIERRVEGDEAASGRILHRLAQGDAGAGGGIERAVFIGGGGDDGAEFVPSGGRDEIIPGDAPARAAGEAQGGAPVRRGKVGGREQRGHRAFRGIQVGIEIEAREVVRVIELQHECVGGVRDDERRVIREGETQRVNADREFVVVGDVQRDAERDNVRAEIRGADAEERRQRRTRGEGDTVIDGLRDGAGHARGIIHRAIALERAVVFPLHARIARDEPPRSDDRRAGEVVPSRSRAVVADGSEIFVVPKRAAAFRRDDTIGIIELLHADDLRRGGGGEAEKGGGGEADE